MSVESYLATVKRVIQWAIRDVNRLIDSVDMGDPDGARDALQAEMPGLIAAWGEAAATIAAEYFEELIGEPATLADPVDTEVVESMVGWAVGPLYGELVPRVDDDGDPVLDDSGEPVVDKIPPDPGKARRNLQGASQRHVMDTGRNTIRYNAESRPGVGWARVLQGEEDCAWCVTMASRGAVFSSKETASMVSSKDPIAAAAHKTHNFCDCAILPIRDDSDYPAGYSVDKYYDMYLAARRSADAMVLKSSDAEPGQSTILSEMRRLHGLH